MDYVRITDTSRSPYQVGDIVYDKLSRSTQTIVEVEVLKWCRKWADGSDESYFFKVGTKRDWRDIWSFRRA